MPGGRREQTVAEELEEANVTGLGRARAGGVGGLVNQWGGFGFHPGTGKAGEKQEEELGGCVPGVCPRGLRGAFAL